MMSSFEYSAKNVNKAIENACAELNLSPDEIKYDILSHGSSGIFGLAGIKKAKIRVHLPEKPKEPDPPPVTPTETEEPDTQDTMGAEPQVDEGAKGKWSRLKLPGIITAGAGAALNPDATYEDYGFVAEPHDTPNDGAEPPGDRDF